MCRCFCRCDSEAIRLVEGFQARVPGGSPNLGRAYALAAVERALSRIRFSLTINPPGIAISGNTLYTNIIVELSERGVLHVPIVLPF